jgi:hypothetical protein
MCQSTTELENIAIKSWDCITINLKHRDVDLVIPNEDSMTFLLRLLIYKIETIDGLRNSASKLLEAMDNE